VRLIDNRDRCCKQAIALRIQSGRVRFREEFGQRTDQLQLVFP
jgi:hypothetical protein